MLEVRSPPLKVSADNFRRLPLQPTLESELLDKFLSPTLTSSTLLDKLERDDEVESMRLRGASAIERHEFKSRKVKKIKCNYAKKGEKINEFGGLSYCS